MPQFTAYRNRNRRTRADIPFLLTVQHDLLSHLTTRVVIPLYLKKPVGTRPIARLTPEIQLEGKLLVVMTSELGAVSTQELGEAVGSLAHHRAEIIAALDLLISGF